MINLPYPPNSSVAYARLVGQLCDAITTFANATAEARQVRVPRRCSAANDATNQPETHLETATSDLIGMNEILREFGLKRSQVLKLREHWAFPPPTCARGKLLFSRLAIESWARSQPNRDNLAIVLRSRKRRHAMRTG